MEPIQKKTIRLSDLSSNEKGIITKVNGYGAFRSRITEMGFVKGKIVTVIKKAPLRDPVEYELMGYNVSLRRKEAKLIEVEIFSGEEPDINANYSGVLDDNTMKSYNGTGNSIIKIALVGNPNSGKTTLFNFASGSHERVGNYGGVTVDSKVAELTHGKYKIDIVDLPGTYSINEYSPEELFVRMHLMENTPDVVINVLDSSNLERNLYLTTQLIDMNIKVVIALNMYDELVQKGDEFNYAALGEMIGIPMIPTTASKGLGIAELVTKIVDVYEGKDPVVRHIHINYGTEIEQSIAALQKIIRSNKISQKKYSTRYLSIKLLEGDKATASLLESSPQFNVLREHQEIERKRISLLYNERAETVLSDARYGFISGALGETYAKGLKDEHSKKWEPDILMTHRWFGFPIFIFMMWLMFQTTFSLGHYPMKWIESGIGLVHNLVYSSLPAGAIRDMLTDGLIAGVGGVIIFLPNILILFFFISLMEDSGYMARAAFIMDKLMHKIGLHGKSFIPLIMGFGCNVPAIMATRTLENRKDRIMTMLITPFMSCSARFPVYVLLISAFFPQNQGLVLFSIYIVGILIAVVSALALKKTVFKKESVPFVMELPPYRIPTLRNTTIHMWNKTVQYLRKMGSIILGASILIWALGYYPREFSSSKYDAEIQRISTGLSIKDKDAEIEKVQLIKESDRQEHSYIGKMGHFIEPAISPLGFDWKIGVSIITGLAAKEIVVSTMSVLYQAGLSSNHSSANLQENLKTQVFTSGSRKGQLVFSPLTAYALMIFILLYFPCVAVIAAIRKEGTAKWALFAMFYTTAIAYTAALIIYQIGRVFFYLG